MHRIKIALSLILLTPVVVFCDVYRFYVVQFSADAEEFSKLPPEQLIAQSTGGTSKIYAFAEIDSGSGNSGSFSDVHEIEFADRLESDGSVKSKAKKKIGTEFTIKEEKEGVVAYSFSDTRVERWESFAPKTNVVLPILKTVKSGHQRAVKINSVTTLGTQTDKGLTTVYLLERRTVR